MIHIPQDLITEIIVHVKQEYPNEACGILAGKGGRVDTSTPLSINGERSRTVEKIYRMTNRDKSSKTFFMDPKEQLKVMKDIRNLGLEMVGIYHSHLNTEAYPSAHDVELAYYPEASYVIVSMKEKDNPSIRSFRIEEGKVIEEAVKII